MKGSVNEPQHKALSLRGLNGTHHGLFFCPFVSYHISMNIILKYSAISAAAVGFVIFVSFASKTLYEGLKAGAGEEQPHYVGSSKSATGKSYELVSSDNSSSWQLIRDGVTIATVERDLKGMPGDFRILSSAIPGLAKGMRFGLTVSGQPGGNFYVCDCALISMKLENSPDGLPVFWHVPKK